MFSHHRIFPQKITTVPQFWTQHMQHILHVRSHHSDIQTHNYAMEYTHMQSTWELGAGMLKPLLDIPQPPGEGEQPADGWLCNPQLHKSHRYIETWLPCTFSIMATECHHNVSSSMQYRIRKKKDFEEDQTSVTQRVESSHTISAFIIINTCHFFCGSYSPILKTSTWYL